MRCHGILLFLLLLNGCDSHEAKSSANATDEEQTTVLPKSAPFDPAQCSYDIEGQFVSLHAGKHEQKIGDGASKQTTIITQVFPRHTVDGADESTPLIAVLLQRNSGGSGNFHYLAVAFEQDGACVGSNAQMLGDRVQIDSVDFQAANLRVHGKVHSDGAAMSDAPDKAQQWLFRFSHGELLPAGNP